MFNQARWHRLLGARWSMLKFRLPWAEGKTRYPFGKVGVRALSRAAPRNPTAPSNGCLTALQRLPGQVYIQPYCAMHSTETRLVVKEGAQPCEWDNTQYVKSD